MKCANPKCSKEVPPSKSRNRKHKKIYCCKKCGGAVNSARYKERLRIEKGIPNVPKLFSPRNNSTSTGSYEASRACQEIGIRWSYGAGYKLKAGYDRYTLQCSS